MDSIPLQEIAHKVNSTGWDILQLLSKTEEMSRTDIETKLHLTQFKGAEQIARLQSACLIDYSRDEDFRYKKFKLTNYGLEILKLK